MRRRALMAAIPWAMVMANCVILACAQARAGEKPVGLEAQGKATAYVNGQWFDGKRFVPKTAYVVNGMLTFRRPREIGETVNLHGGYVVAPFGEAHNHNVENAETLPALNRRYLEHGIFYVKNPTNLPRARDQVAPLVNRPDTIGVVFANGGFTSRGGHPLEVVKRNLARGGMTEADGDGAFYHAVNSESELEKKWPRLLATQPDFVKTTLVYSEEYTLRENDPKFEGWRGLSPVLLAMVVKKAHAAGLRVSAHVESAADFHNALAAGVDEINHTPGFRMFSDVRSHPASDFQIREADARLAARRGVCVVTTLGGTAGYKQNGPDAEKRKVMDALHRRNLTLLKKHKVHLALGSDSYRSDTLPEAEYLHGLGVFENRELLQMWSENTARTIFPKRKIGALREGYEASFLVLAGDPLKDWNAVKDIRMRVKRGKRLDLGTAQ